MSYIFVHQKKKNSTTTCTTDTHTRARREREADRKTNQMCTDTLGRTDISEEKAKGRHVERQTCTERETDRCVQKCGRGRKTMIKMRNRKQSERKTE